MKKKNDKKLNNSELKPLSDELGIEPPKIYRSEQKQRINAEYYEKQSKSNKSKSNKNNQSNLSTNGKKKKPKRKLKKKYRNILYTIFLALLIVFVLIILSLTVLFKIETITVEGNQKYDAQQIVQNTPIELQSNLFLADVDNAEKMLETNLPYLYEVNIKRKIPSKIIVNVKEADEFYTAKNSDSTYILMDNNFKVLEIGLQDQPQDALLIDSVAIENASIGQILTFSDSDIKASMTEVNNKVKELRISEITSIYATDSNHNFIVYDNRLVIALGNISNLEDKLYTALASVEQLEKTNPMIEGQLNVTDGKQCYFTENK